MSQHSHFYGRQVNYIKIEKTTPRPRGGYVLCALCNHNDGNYDLIKCQADT